MSFVGDEEAKEISSIQQKKTEKHRGKRIIAGGDYAYKDRKKRTRWEWKSGKRSTTKGALEKGVSGPGIEGEPVLRE